MDTTPGSTLSINDFKREIQRRSKIEYLCRNDPEFRKLELFLCRKDPIHLINNWGWTFDPRTSPYHYPFKLYPFQEEFIRWMHALYIAKKHGLVEKTRDMGVTWCAVGFSLWAWLFEGGFVSRWGSRVENEVDDGTVDSIFGKQRYIIQRLPPMLRPSGFEHKKFNHHLTLKNPKNENLILGESASPNFGRSGRSRVAFLDEFAHVQHSEAVWASVSETSDSIFCLSTPAGQGNQFYWLRHHSSISVSSLHWTKHPKKNREWYEAKKKDMQPWQVAQELDISYEKSKAGRIYKRFDRAYHVADEVIKYQPLYEQAVAWDFGHGAATAIIWLQIDPTGQIQVWNYYELTDQDIDFHLPISMGEYPDEIVLVDDSERKFIEKVVAKVPKNFTERHDYGDHAGTAKTANSKRSCKQALKNAGLEFKSTPKQTYDWRIRCTDNLMKLRQNAQGEWESRFQISPDCTKLIDCINNYVWDSENTDKDDIKPKIDWASHGVTALEFFAINRFPIKTSSTGVRVQDYR
ncbi:MAG: hypothetical protein E6R04_10695 [Spirochaetes bacterium]|nr:MAG: hypothetical protein E6R04_10695 [Spirochaetota bacterium]